MSVLVQIALDQFYLFGYFCFLQLRDLHTITKSSAYLTIVIVGFMTSLGSSSPVLLLAEIVCRKCYISQEGGYYSPLWSPRIIIVYFTIVEYIFQHTIYRVSCPNWYFPIQKSVYDMIVIYIIKTSFNITFNYVSEGGWSGEFLEKIFYCVVATSFGSKPKTVVAEVVFSNWFYR